MAWLVLLLSGCSSPAEQPLRIGANTWLGYEPLYFAREEGLLDPAEVQLVEMVTAADVLHAFRGRMLEGAAVTLDEALTLRAEGQDLRVVLAFDVSNGADGLVARSGIDSMEGLRGRRVGFESNAVGAVVLESALAMAGLTPQDIEPVTLAANEHLSAFSEGRVDAVVTFQPILGRLVAEQGGRLLYHSGQFPDRIVDVLVVHEDVYRQRQAALAGVLRGWFGALAQLHREPKAAAARMGERHGIAAEDLLGALEGMRLLDLGENRRMLSGGAPALMPTARSLAETMVRRGLLPRNPELTEFLGAASLEVL